MNRIWAFDWYQKSATLSEWRSVNYFVLFWRTW